MSYRGPDAIWLVRHGQSRGNVANDDAARTGAEVLDLERDADVLLSELGERQATAVGQWLRELPGHERPTVALSSPYRRAMDTAIHAVTGLGELPVRVDERLRDRELGVLDLHTRNGIAARFPAEAERRAHLGKFYHRPPGGESWADVAMRLRALLTDPMLNLDGERVVCFTHEALVYLTRYILEQLTEAELMDAVKAEPVANCSVTWFERSGPNGPLRLVEVGRTDHLPRHDAPTTREPDVRTDQA